MSLYDDDWIDVHTLQDDSILQKSARDSSYRVKGSTGNSLGIFTKVGREMERLAMRVRELEGASPPIFPPTTRWESETQRHLSTMEIDLRAAEQKIAALLAECLPKNGPSISTRLERLRGHLQEQINQLRETYHTESARDQLAIVIDRLIQAERCADPGSVEAKELTSTIHTLKRYLNARTL